MKVITKLSVVAAAAALIAQPASATPSLYLENGAFNVTVTDGGGGDINPLAGVVTFSGAVGNYIVNVTTGTLTLGGTPADPNLDLNSVDVSSGAGGILKVLFSEIGYLPQGQATALIGGTTTGTVLYNTYADAGNVVFGTGTLLTTSGVMTAGAFSDTQVGLVPFSGPYALTLEVLVTHGAAFQSSSFDASLTVPDGGMTILLLGSALVGIGAIRRRLLA